MGCGVQSFPNLLDHTLFCGRGTLYWCSSNTVWKVLFENIPVRPFSCGLILPQFHWEEARLFLSFCFGPVLKSKSSLYICHLFHICIILFCLLGLLDNLGFLLKYPICCFSLTPSSVVNLRDFYLCINDIFDPFSWPLSPFSSCQCCLSAPSPTPSPFFRTALLPSSACNLCAFTSLHPTSTMHWYLILSKSSDNLFPYLFSSMCLTIFIESLFYCFQYDLHAHDPPPCFFLTIYFSKIGFICM